MNNIKLIKCFIRQRRAFLPHSKVIIYSFENHYIYKLFFLEKLKSGKIRNLRHLQELNYLNTGK